MHRVTRRIPLVALGAAALAAACAKGDGTADSARAGESAAASTASAATAPAQPAAPALTDANIAAILDHANMADSADGSVAASKGTSAEVRAFGRDMMRDHHALRRAGEDLARKNSLTAELPAGDDRVARARAWHDSLAAMPKGAAFDRAYIDHEVAAHTEVLATAQRAADQAQNAELKAFIQKAAPNIQAHLDHAKQIQGRLGAAAPPATP